MDLTLYNKLKEERAACLAIIKAGKDAIKAATEKTMSTDKFNRALFEERRDRIAAAHEKNDTIILFNEVKSRVLFEQMKAAYIDAVAPVVLAAFSKYNGKQYGPKTKEKIQAEVKAACQCHFYVAYKYAASAVFELIPLSPEGFSGFGPFARDDLQFSTAPIVDHDNRITPQAGFTACSVNAANIGTPADEQTAAIIDAYHNYTKALEEAAAARDAFAGIIPAGVRRPDYFSKYYTLL